jgi:hypothetical protein
MKGVPGLLLAIGLGIAGAFASWFYLAQKTRELDQIEFMAIAPDREINSGHQFVREDFHPVPIPARNIGNLERVAMKWDMLSTIVGTRARKAYAPSELFLNRDVTTPPDTDIRNQLGDNESLFWVPVDSRTTVTSLLNAGNIVSFIVPRKGGPTPLGATPNPAAAQMTEIIGPFRIVSLGNRQGSAEAMRAAGIAPMQESTVGIAVKIVKGQIDENSQKLADALRMSNNQQVQVLLHKAVDPKKK